MNLLTFLQRNSEVRKIFGQRELKIIEKQLLGINLTQSEKNRLSRDIRRKFGLIQNLAQFQQEFALKKGAILKEKISKMAEVILEDQLRPKIRRITLYGSVVENTITFRSDIDLAVMFDAIDVSEATRFRIRVLGKLSEKADVQVYNILPKKIKNEIDKKGRVLYEHKD